MSGGVIIDRPNGIRIFQLHTVKRAINLELLGMKNSRGSVKVMWAKHYGMKPRAPAVDVLAKIDAEIKQLETAGDLGIRAI